MHKPKVYKYTIAIIVLLIVVNFDCNNIVVSVLVTVIVNGLHALACTTVIIKITIAKYKYR